MSESYRIAPSGHDGWKVQGRWLGLFWRDLGRWVGMETWEPYWFKTEAEAEKHIDAVVEFQRDVAAHHRTTELRKREISPRIYPAPALLPHQEGEAKP